MIDHSMLPKPVSETALLHERHCGGELTGIQPTAIPEPGSLNHKRIAIPSPD